MLQKLFNKQAYEPFQAAEKAENDPQGAANVTRLVPVHSAPGTSIRYNPDLIAHFRKHHAWFRKTVASIKVHVEKNEFTDAQEALLTFRRMLTTHLLEENIKIYTYVAKCLAHDPDTMASMQAMKADMEPAGSAMMRFANEYAKAGLTPFNKQEFLAGFDEVAAALLRRMEWEEGSLYTMYMPPDAYK